MRTDRASQHVTVVRNQICHSYTGYQVSKRPRVMGTGLAYRLLDA